MVKRLLDVLMLTVARNDIAMSFHCGFLLRCQVSAFCASDITSCSANSGSCLQKQTQTEMRGMIWQVCYSQIHFIFKQEPFLDLTSELIGGVTSSHRRHLPQPLGSWDSDPDNTAILYTWVQALTLSLETVMSLLFCEDSRTLMWN